MVVKLGWDGVFKLMGVMSLLSTLFTTFLQPLPTLSSSSI
jgi:hypothetical protein